MKLNLEAFTHRFVNLAGSAAGFVTALLSIVLWLLFGYYHEFSTHWQTAMQIYIGILTFLILFLIQRGQSKEIATLQLKLDELIVVTRDADDTLVNATELSEREIQQAHDVHRREIQTK